MAGSEGAGDHVAKTRANCSRAVRLTPRIQTRHSLHIALLCGPPDTDFNTLETSTNT